MKNFLIIQWGSAVFGALFVSLSFAGGKEGLGFLPLSASVSRLPKSAFNSEFIKMLDLWDSVEETAFYVYSDAWKTSCNVCQGIKDFPAKLLRLIGLENIDCDNLSDEQNKEIINNLKLQKFLDTHWALKHKLQSGLQIRGEAEYRTYFDQKDDFSFDRGNILKDLIQSFIFDNAERNLTLLIREPERKHQPFSDKFEVEIESIKKELVISSDYNKHEEIVQKKKELITELFFFLRLNEWYFFVLFPEVEKLSKDIDSLPKKLFENKLKSPLIDQVKGTLKVFSVFIAEGVSRLKTIQPMLQPYNQGFLNVIQEDSKKNNVKALYVLCTNVAALLSAMISDYNNLLKLAKKHSRILTFRKFDTFKYPVTFGPRPIFLFKRFGVKFEFKGVPR